MPNYTVSSDIDTILRKSTKGEVATFLGLVIGTDVQAYNAGLSDIAGLTPTNESIIKGDGTNWVAATNFRVDAGTAGSGTEMGSGVANGNMAIAEGLLTTASGIASHAEGLSSRASGNYSHAEGDSTVASGEYSHAEGGGTTASGIASHAEGQETTASGNYSSATGNRAKAIHDGARVEADSQYADVSSTTTDQYTARFQNGYAFKGGRAVFEGEIEATDIKLQTGATVNTIETTLTDDDTHIPTSGAVVDYFDRKFASPITVITGTGGQTHSRYKNDGWTKAQMDAIDTSFGGADIETVIFGTEVPTATSGILKNQILLKFVDFGEIGIIAFEACRGCTSLKRVITRTSNKIGQTAFLDCSSLTEVDLGSVVDIGAAAFSNCTSLTSVTIPASVTVLGNLVFDQCFSLSEVNCYADQSVFDPVGGNVFLGTASPLVIHAKPNTGWTAGEALTFQGNTNVTVILDLV
jgi:hypothetical protein